MMNDNVIAFGVMSFEKKQFFSLLDIFFIILLSGIKFPGQRTKAEASND